MTDENKVTQGGGQTPNPPTEQKADAPGKQEPQPQKEQGASADLTSLKAQLDEMKETLERYKEQVSGSSKEALRLKDENESLKNKVKELEESGTSAMSDDFQKIMEDQGLQAAVDFAIKNKIESLQTRIDAFEKKESVKVLDKFKASHKGLNNPEVLERFDTEFSRLKDVYDVNEALEKAYVLAGGPQAETTAPKKEDVDNPQKKADEEKVVKSVLGGEEDKKPTPSATVKATEVQQRIEDLQYEAHVLQSQGRIRQAAEILSKVEDLKGQLGEKV